MTAPGGNWEAQRVAELRERGIPWPHVAKMVGRNEIDIRRTYDPALKAANPVIEPPPPKPAKPTKDRKATGVYVRRAIECPTVVVPGTRVAQVLELAADGVEMTRVWIAEKIGVTPHAASDSIANLFKRDMLERTRTGWLITAYGLEVVELLREARDAA